jgi:hypothetical protein
MSPLVGVRLSPYLDQLERAVMSAFLHHVGALTRVLSTDAVTYTPQLQDLCRSVASAAREVRRYVTEQRDLANLALKEGAEPLEWSEYTNPVVERCRLVLATAPVWVLWGSEDASMESDRCDAVCADTDDFKSVLAEVSKRLPFFG